MRVRSPRASARWVQATKRSPSRDRGRLVIRDATDRDFGDLLLLWRELMDVHVVSDERFALSEHCDQRFRNYVETARSRDDYRVRVAVEDALPVGFVICCVLPNSPVYRTRWIGYINDIVVTQGAQGRGIGTALVQDAVDWMCDHGAESIEVYVAKANVGAARFWRELGGTDYLERLSLDPSRFGRGR